jgi:signal peptidase I
MGNSMAPVLIDHDIIYVIPISKGGLTRGDIIVRKSEELVTHRCIAIRDGKICSKGDARYWLDPPADPREIIGKVRLIERLGYQVALNIFPWNIINQAIGSLGWLQTIFAGVETTSIKSNIIWNWMHRTSYWLGKRIIWIILFIMDYRWLRLSSSRKV